MATLKDIAREAGVSVMTVSNVINRNYDKVSAKTVERVEHIIRKHHYVPNLSARSLSGKGSHIVTVLIPEGEEPLRIFEDPYRQGMIGCLEFSLRQKGYYMMLRTYQTARDVISLFDNWSVDGAIFFYPSISEEEMRKVLRTGVPCVVLDRFYKDLKPLTVDLDDYHGGNLPARFLLENGHRRIAFACPFRSRSIVVSQRIRGFAQALKEAGVSFPARYFFNTSGSFEDGVRVGRSVCAMRDRPTAVVTTLDRLAVGVLEGVRLSGYNVPNDVSIIGFDNWEVLRYVRPTLTTVSQDLDKKAACAVELLLDSIQGKEIQYPHITLDVELLERQSVRKLN